MEHMVKKQELLMQQIINQLILQLLEMRYLDVLNVVIILNIVKHQIMKLIFQLQF
jgi:hypothetical protein